MSTVESQTFALNFQTLKQGVEKLRVSSEDDIDSLVEQIEKITQAHRACKARIEAIRLIIDKSDKDLHE